MRILITGASGFLGLHVCSALLQQGHTLTAALRTERPPEALRQLQTRYPQSLHMALHGPHLDLVGQDGIIHMATQYGRSASSRTSDIIEANVLMPARLLENAIAHGLQFFVNTDTYYAKAGQGHPLQNYIRSKAQFLEWAEVMAGTRMRLIHLRLEHLYGPGDAMDKFCTALTRNCLNHLPRIALTSGQQMRDFLFVEDAAKAYACLLQGLSGLAKGCHSMEVGTGQAMALRDFCRELHAATGSTSVLGFGDIALGPGEIGFSAARPGLLQTLGWHSTTSLQEGMAALIADVRRRMQ